MLLPYRKWLEIASLSAPLIIYYLSEVLIGLTDLLVVGSLGAVAVAAVGLGKSIVINFAVVGFSVLSLLAILIGKRVGKPDRKAPMLARNAGALRSGFAVALFLSLLGFAIFSVCPYLLQRLEYDPVLIEEFQDYFSWAQLMIPPALFLACLRSALNAIASTRVFTWIAIFMVLSNACLNVVLVHGFWFIPPLGVQGAGIATVLVHCLGFLIALFHVLRMPEMSLRLLNPLGFARRDVAFILWLGAPAGAQDLLEGGLFLAVLFFMGTFSADWLAATSVGFALLEVAIVVCLGYNETVSAEIARRLGDLEFDRVRRLITSTFITTMVFMLVCSVILLSAPETLTGVMFRGEVTASVIEIAKWILTLVACFLVFFGLEIAGMFTLRGMQNTVIPFLASVIGYWLLGLGSGLVLAYPLQLGPRGIWIGLCAGSFLISMSLVSLSYMRLRKINLKSGL